MEHLQAGMEEFYFEWNEISYTLHMNMNTICQSLHEFPPVGSKTISFLQIKLANEPPIELEFSTRKEKQTNKQQSTVNS